MASQESTPPVRRRFGAGMVVLGVALAVNTLLGPLVAGAVDYPFTETVYNETLGLEAVSLALVAPLAVFAGLLSVAGRRAGPAIALGISAYTAYMMVQYVVGPQYPTYQPAVLLHLAIFVLAVALLLRAWTLEDGDLRGRSPRRWAGVVLAMGAFVVFRWLPALTGVAGNDPVPAEPADVTMYWAIFLLDLGLVVPAALATGVGLLRGASWSVTALYAVVGWFALVPPSVAAMSIVKVLRDDPNGTVGDSVMFLVVALVGVVVAVLIFRPLFSGERESVPAARPS